MKNTLLLTSLSIFTLFSSSPHQINSGLQCSKEDFEAILFPFPSYDVYNGPPVPLCDSSTCGPPPPDKIDDECTYKGFKLYGKIKVVEHFGDLKVKVVKSFADLKVKIVENFPNNCGEWQIVENFPDLKIEYVEVGADLEIEFVECNPGKP